LFHGDLVILVKKFWAVGEINICNPTPAISCGIKNKESIRLRRKD